MKSSSSSPIFLFLLLLSFAATFIFAYGEVIFKDGLKNSVEFRLPSAEGPESFAFDCNGEGPYTGLSDGRILKWQRTREGWVEFAVTSPNRDRKLCDGSTDPTKEPTCGRPLGLKFDRKTCNLYIADAYFGLLMVGLSGGVAKQLAISASDGGAPFKFLNGLDVDDQTGVVYFSESSTVYQRRFCFVLFCLCLHVLSLHSYIYDMSPPTKGSFTSTKVRFKSLKGFHFISNRQSFGISSSLFFHTHHNTIYDSIRCDRL